MLLSLVEVIRNKPAMLAIWSYAFHSWELLGLWAWLPTYLAAVATRIAWGMAWLVLGVGALPGLVAIMRLRRISPAGTDQPTT